MLLWHSRLCWRRECDCYVKNLAAWATEMFDEGMVPCRCSATASRREACMIRLLGDLAGDQHVSEKTAKCLIKHSKWRLSWLRSPFIARLRDLLFCIARCEMQQAATSASAGSSATVPLVHAS